MLAKTTSKIYGYFLLGTGIIGLIASFVITWEKLQLLQDIDYVPSCSINPVISCGSVMKTLQAEVFGFPNSWLGLVGFMAVIVVGAGLLAGGQYKAWYWRLFNAGTLAGVVFIHWLFGQSVYVTQALCPWCMVVWLVTIPIFWYTTLYNVRQGYLPVPKVLAPAVGFLQEYKHLALVVWYLGIAALVLHHFWYYFRTLL